LADASVANGSTDGETQRRSAHRRQEQVKEEDEKFANVCLQP